MDLPAAGFHISVVVGAVGKTMLNANSLGDFVDRLGSEASFAGAWTSTCEFFATHGLPFVCYGYAEGEKDATPHIPAPRSNVRSDFLNRWVEEKLACDDPGVRHAASSLHSKAFGFEFMARSNSSTAVYEYYSDLREIGSYSVLTVPMRNNARSASGFLSIGGRFLASDMGCYLAECQDRLTLAAHYADQRLVELTKVEEATEAGLSPREIQCLQRLAKGSRNDRIADSLGITQPTVKLHLQNARRKLRASTREQAIARAVYLGLVEP